METSCTWVANADWFNQAAVLGTLIVGLGVVATSRGRQLVSELVNDEDAPEAETATAGVRAA